ncbi:MAG TPA: NmrA/HSCARG family protein [Polyangiaceae bacterium]
MNDRKLVLVTGATGHQGGAVARRLLNRGFAVRAATRNPSSAAAKKLSSIGCEVVRADYDEATSLERVLGDVWGVYSVQSLDQGTKVEEERGIRLAELAKRAGIETFVYSSVASADRDTGIPHFDSKLRIEERIRALGFERAIVVRPVFFMENLIAPTTLKDGKLMSLVPLDRKLQMVSADDIGRFVAYAFAHSKDLAGDAIDIAGDEVTFREVASILGKAFKTSITPVRVPLDDVRKMSPDMAAMAEWFDRVGYDVDIRELERSTGMRFSTLMEWAAKQTPPKKKAQATHAHA